MRTRTYWGCMLAALAMGGCSGEQGAPGVSGSNGAAALVRLDPEAAGANCASGGIAVRSGLDLNDNGVLDAGEVTATSYVCNGEAGASTLLAVTVEPAGANCPAGGQRVDAGVDANGNGALDAVEVSATRYVCNGAGGTATLVALSDEPPGANCASGGVAVSSGIDANANGVLDEPEFVATRYVCNGADTLFTTEALAAGDAHCAKGGVALHHGLDLDGDGTLDPGEVTGTDWVCNGAPGASGLVAVGPEAAGANCAQGGQAIRSGVDANGDGLLQPAEVTSTAYVCNGAAGLASLVRQEDEPAGAHCAFGGKAILSGVDGDRDGLLDPAEVTATTYVCNGATGAAGAASLVALSTEPAGDRCAAGGLKVETGLDASGDGVLDADEVQNTAYLCSGTGGGVARVYATSVAQWGGVCARGGVRVDTGLDADGDGTLDPAEIDAGATQYVCNLYYAAVAAGLGHTCALVSDGTARCWGSNTYGEVGDGTVVNRATPVAVSGLSGVTALAAGGYHTCALAGDGSARCWGRNGRGQLGDGTQVEAHAPVPVSGLAGASSLSAGIYHTCAALADGTARCWGSNASGQLGDGSTTDRLTPVAVVGLAAGDRVAAIAAGGGSTTSSHTCAALADGTARCWGADDVGQLGDGGELTPSSTPVAVLGVSGATAVAAGSYHACAVTGGSARCWGRNGDGQLGDGTQVDAPAPVEVSGLTTAASISAGERHTCAALTDGTARCWGYGLYGRLGDGTYTSRLTPVAVSGVAGAASVLAGGAHSCAAITAGTLRCWGSNASGQLGNGSSTYSLTAVLVLGGI